MDILIYLRNLLKIKDPNSISSLKIDIEFKNIKLLWEKYLKEGTTKSEIDKSFSSLLKIGSVSNKVGVLNVYSKKDTENMFGLYFCKNETKYLKINSKQIKNILDKLNDVTVLSYIIRLP
jgi:hypothetical protein